MDDEKLPEAGTPPKENILSYAEDEIRVPWWDNSDRLCKLLRNATLVWGLAFAAAMFVGVVSGPHFHVVWLEMLISTILFIANASGSLFAGYLVGRHDRISLFIVLGLLFHGTMVAMSLLGVGISITNWLHLMQ